MGLKTKNVGLFYRSLFKFSFKGPFWHFPESSFAEMYMNVYAYIHTNVYIHVYIQTNIHLHIYIYLYVYNTFTYIYIYTYLILPGAPMSFVGSFPRQHEKIRKTRKIIQFLPHAPIRPVGILPRQHVQEYKIKNKPQKIYICTYVIFTSRSDSFR